MTAGNIVVFNKANEPLKLQNIELPALKTGEILIKNAYTTICGSDLHTFCGLRQEKTPTVLGHEIVGRIIQIDAAHSALDYAGQHLHIGDLVTWAVFCSSPQPEWTAKGMPQKAENLFKYGHAQIVGNDAFHGGLGDYCILKANTAILKIPNELPLPIAATINCALATVAGTIRLAGDLNGKTILITGLGLLGNVTAAMAKVAGAKNIIAIDINDERLAQAKTFGVDFAYHSTSQEDLPETLAKHQINAVFDMSGAPDAIELGINALTIGGIAVWAGAVFKMRKIAIDAEQIVRKIITIKGLHNYNFEDLRYALDFISNNYQKFPFDKVVAKEFALEDTQKAFEYAVAHKPLRVGVKID